jgi:undecaprenyl diphosphate synthase
VTEDSIPKHIGIIMDGNRRWARKNGLKDIEGHRAGADNLSKIVDTAADLGVETLTVYALSTENLTHRTAVEVKQLFDLLLEATGRHLKEMQKKGVSVAFIGELNDLPMTIRRAISKTIKVFVKNERIKVNIALNYGSRREIVQAVQELIKEGIKPTEVDEEKLSEKLYTRSGHDPDLIIRTGGEVRLSNFLLWQSSYSEFYFTDTLWPDFGPREFQKAISQYSDRKRNFGA